MDLIGCLQVCQGGTKGKGISGRGNNMSRDMEEERAPLTPRIVCLESQAWARGREGGIMQASVPAEGVWAFSCGHQSNQGIFPAGQHIARAVSGRSPLKGKHDWDRWKEEGGLWCVFGTQVTWPGASPTAAQLLPTWDTQNHSSHGLWVQSTCLS